MQSTSSGQSVGVGIVTLMTQEQQPRRYTQDEVGDLIETASKLEWAAATSSTTDVSLEELKSIASEMGISDQALAAALAKQQREDREAEVVRAEARKRQKRVKAAWTAWRTHIAVYVAVILGLAVLNLITGGPAWVQYPAAGWGIGLFVHTAVMLANRGDMPD